MTDIEETKAKMVDAGLDPQHFLPGGFGYHEALHTAHLCNVLFEELYTHWAIRLDPELEKAADKAAEALGDLYQIIGKKS